MPYRKYVGTCKLHARFSAASSRNRGSPPLVRSRLCVTSCLQCFKNATRKLPILHQASGTPLTCLAPPPSRPACVREDQGSGSPNTRAPRDGTGSERVDMTQLSAGRVNSLHVQVFVLLRQVTMGICLVGSSTFLCMVHVRSFTTAEFTEGY